MQAGGSPEEVVEIKEFAEWLLRVGDGLVGKIH